MTKREAIEILEEVKTLDDSMFAYSQAYNDALDMAIEALKELEPHVMTLEEVESAEVVWFEARKSLYIEPMLTRGKNFNDSADWFKYGQDWRCWTSHPTDEQREAIPWN